jgi:hypothetical protein
MGPDSQGGIDTFRVLLQPGHVGISHGQQVLELSGADGVKFPLRYVMVEMHHPVAVTSQDPQLVGRIRSQHPLPFELFGDFLVFGYCFAENLGQQMAA